MNLNEASKQRSVIFYICIFSFTQFIYEKYPKDEKILALLVDGRIKNINNVNDYNTHL